jgi:hypothetical protein
VKHSVYGLRSYDSHSPYFPYVDILNLTVEKIPYNIEAAAAEVVGGSNPTRSISSILGKYGIELSSIFNNSLFDALYAPYERGYQFVSFCIILAELVIAAPQTIGGLCAFIA